MIEHIDTKGDFEKKVLNSAGKSMVDFYADWCGPCAMFAPVFEDFSLGYPDCHFYKVNVDKMTEVAAGLQIDSIPCIIVFTDGKETARAVGARNKESLKSMLER